MPLDDCKLMQFWHFSGTSLHIYRGVYMYYMARCSNALRKQMPASSGPKCLMLECSYQLS